MRIHRHHTALAPQDRGSVVALGNFDGLHLGHQAVIGEAGERAKTLGAPHAVLTFEPHPRSVFRPEDPPFRLAPFRTKARLIEKLGADLLFGLHFDLDFAKESAETFVDRVVIEGLGARELVVGRDFVFGNKRRGNPALLQELGAKHGFAVRVIEPLRRADGEKAYSSTRIRDQLQSGQPREAAEVLGRFWEIEGRVQHGDQRGRTLGFPTANMNLGEYLRPQVGVYAVRAGIPGPEGRTTWHDAVANLGMRPTVGGLDLRLETHLFDFSGDLYGRHLRVALVDFLRPEKKFDGLAALKDQIAKDSETARAILAKEPPTAD